VFGFGFGFDQDQNTAGDYQRARSLGPLAHVAVYDLRRAHRATGLPAAIRGTPASARTDGSGRADSAAARQAPTRKQKLEAWRSQGADEGDLTFLESNPELIDNPTLTRVASEEAAQHHERGTEAHRNATREMFHALLQQAQAAAATTQSAFFAPPTPHRHLSPRGQPRMCPRRSAAAQSAEPGCRRRVRCGSRRPSRRWPGSPAFLMSSTPASGSGSTVRNATGPGNDSPLRADTPSGTRKAARIARAAEFVVCYRRGGLNTSLSNLNRGGHFIGLNNFSRPSGSRRRAAA
jgi:hypothetical protein